MLLRVGKRKTCRPAVSSLCPTVWRGLRFIVFKFIPHAVNGYDMARLSAVVFDFCAEGHYIGVDVPFIAAEFIVRGKADKLVAG